MPPPTPNNQRRGLRAKWELSPLAPPELFEALRGALPAVAIQVLYTRGLRDREAILDFVLGVHRAPEDPALLVDLERAIERLERARERGERVAVFTDYDADGINAAAVLATGLRRVGIEPLVRLPNRFTDGYGIQPQSVDELAERGATVIVTADNGTSAFAAAERARERGVDLIVTDHHQCTHSLPPAYALLNPHRPDDGYPFKGLCGAGVAYKLLQGLADALLPEGRAAMADLLDLVAVATVADIMPLTDENRRLVLQGLQLLNAWPRPGLRALMEVAGLQPGQVDAVALGWRLAPRLNAAGRLDDPTLAYRLLMAEDLDAARELAAEINRLNVERQALCKTLEVEAEVQANAQRAVGAAGLVVGGEGWQPGLVGLVAGRMAQTFFRPTLAYTILDSHSAQSEIRNPKSEMVSGSGRSIPGFNLLAALESCAELFDRFGGHQAACGFALPAERLPELAERFDAFCRAALPPDLEPALRIDAQVTPDRLELEFAQALERLAPWGASFPEPLFLVRGATVHESRPVNGGHWRLRVRAARGTPIAGIMWGAGDLAAQFRPGQTVDLVCRVKQNEYQGTRRVDLEVLDLLAKD
ncbi:MAG: single-stranded-DNA-specific exonuclease RecJ [Chloroflexi bacterium]|nr:single-stranded-DNA-specific exonuclease RecJ [Chloroflexota bacterium]